MKKTTGTVIYALLFAGAALFAQVAQAVVVDISSPSRAITLSSNGSVNFGDKFKNKQKSNTFSDKFTFTTTGLTNVDLIVTSTSTSSLNGLNLTGLGLYNAQGQVAAGAQLLTGMEDKWNLSFNHLAAGSYFFKVSGDMVSNTGATFAANGHILAAVPEPETYAMLLGGLAMLGFVARRRKHAAAV